MKSISDYQSVWIRVDFIIVNNAKKSIPSKWKTIIAVQSGAFKRVNALSDPCSSSRILLDFGAKEKFAETHYPGSEEEGQYVQQLGV